MLKPAPQTISPELQKLATFCALVKPDRGVELTTGELIGQVLLELRYGSPKTTIAAIFFLTSLVRLVPVIL